MKNILILLFTVLLFTACENKGNFEIETVNVTITLPDEIHNGEEFEIIAKPEQAIPIKEAVFYLNGEEIGKSTEIIAKIKYTAEDLEPGTYTISCKYKPIENLYIIEGEDITKLALRLGDPYLGGKIFILNADGKSGLVATEKDLVNNSVELFTWGTSEFAGTTNDNGAENTVIMAAKSDSPYSAAYMFKDNHNYNGYADWYIPSIDELKMLQANKQYLSNFTTGVAYWSSSESDAANAYGLIVTNNDNNPSLYSKSKNCKVRPIRVF